jgi:hypothetical protein
MWCVFRDVGTLCLNGIYRNIRLQRDKIVLVTSFIFIFAMLVFFRKFVNAYRGYLFADRHGISKRSASHNAQNSS